MFSNYKQAGSKKKILEKSLQQNLTWTDLIPAVK